MASDASNAGLPAPRRRLRGGLFGCGMISEFHLRGWQRVPEVEMVAIGNRTVSAAERRRDEYAPAAKVYGDLREMLAAEALDFVDILTPPALHAEHCLAAREAGVHVICQKPLTDDLESARRLVAAMRGSGRVFAVHENHRYRPWFQTILARLREGFFGKLELVRIEQLDPREPAEAYKTTMERAVLLEYGTHLVDMMRALLGEPRRVFARSHHLNPRVAGESLVHVTYDYGAATGLIDVGWKPNGLQQSSLLVVGERGEAYFEGTMVRGERARFRLVSGKAVVLDETRSPYDDYVESFYLFEKECAEAMLSGRPVTQTGEENLKTLVATFAPYLSADEGRVVELAELAGPNP
jgi:D-apiose dehydrogenase